MKIEMKMIPARFVKTIVKLKVSDEEKEQILDMIGDMYPTEELEIRE